MDFSNHSNSNHPKKLTAFSVRRMFFCLISGGLIVCMHTPGTPKVWAESYSQTKSENPDAPSQRNHFTAPIAMTYGDDSVIAPFQDILLTTDWDQDGRYDLVGRWQWWRNTGRQYNGLDLFEHGGEGGIPYVMTLFPPDMAGNLNNNSFSDIVLSTRAGKDLDNQEFQYIWWENTSASGTPKYVKRGPLKFALDRKPVPPESIGYPFHPWLADWDGDGRTDLLIGTGMMGLGSRYLPQPDRNAGRKAGFGTGWIENSWVDGDLTATVWWHRNIGTPEEPLFTGGRLIQAGETGRALTFWAIAKPCAIDWNGDGRLDLFVGAYDRAMVFLNIGTETSWNQQDPVPKLDDGHVLTFDGDPFIPYQNLSFSPFRDNQGLIYLRIRGGEPMLEARQVNPDHLFALGPFQPLPFRNPPVDVFIFPIPDPVDWDGDGKIDLLVGCDTGWIWFIKNLHPDGQFGRWAVPQKLRDADGNPIRFWKIHNLQGPWESLWGYSNPTAVDWDLDGDLDLICGSSAETYDWFENIGNSAEPKLKFQGPLRCGENETPVVTVWRTKPGAGDLNGDGLPDLVGMNENRQLCWWPRYRDPDGKLRLSPPQCPVDSEGKTFTLSKGFRSTGRAKLAVCDWDHDGKPDIISSPPKFENIRYLRYFRNLGVKEDTLLLEFLPDQIILDPPNVEFYLEEFGCGPWGHYYMGMPVDFDRDGLWEVISAVDMDGIYYWKE